MSSRLLICGIDGGGTSSKCALSDGRDIIASSKRGSSNVYAVGFQNALNNVLDSINDCLNSISCTSQELKAIHLSSAGLGDEVNRKRFTDKLLKAFPNARVGVSDDAYPLLWSSGLEGTGVCAISGTGSIAFGINSDGVKIRSGGYGWRLGDEGSAYHIAHEAIRLAVRSTENLAEPTAIVDDVVKFFGFADIRDAIYYVNRDDVAKSQIADFAPLVLKRAYEDGDAVALSVMDYELREYSKYIISVAERMYGEFDRSIVLSGGLIDKSERYRDSIISILKATLLGWDIKPAEDMAAVNGSLKLALNLI